MAFERYKNRYNAACDETKRLFEDNSKLFLQNMTISLASSLEIEQATRWHGDTDYRGFKKAPPNGGWNWQDLYNAQRKNTKKFCISFGIAGELAGMMLGGVSRGKQVVSIHYLDTPPNKTDLSTSISTIAITFSATLGSILNSKFIAVYEPNAPLEKRLVDDFDFSYENPFGVTDAMYRSLT